jgi:hypothetical protein
MGKCGRCGWHDRLGQLLMWSASFLRVSFCAHVCAGLMLVVAWVTDPANFNVVRGALWCSVVLLTFVPRLVENGHCRNLTAP